MSNTLIIKIDFQSDRSSIGFIGPDLRWSTDGSFFRVAQGNHSYFFPASSIKMAQTWYEDEATARLPAPSPSEPFPREIEARILPFNPLKLQ